MITQFKWHQINHACYNGYNPLPLLYYYCKGVRLHFLSLSPAYPYIQGYCFISIVIHQFISHTPVRIDNFTMLYVCMLQHPYVCESYVCTHYYCLARAFVWVNVCTHYYCLVRAFVRVNVCTHYHCLVRAFIRASEVPLQAPLSILWVDIYTHIGHPYNINISSHVWCTI